LKPRRDAVEGDELSPNEARLREFLKPKGTDLDAMAVVYNLYRTATHVITTMEATTLRRFGLSHTGFVLLMTLWMESPREVRELARVQRNSRPAIVSAVNTLVNMGLVKRERGTVDRRLVYVHLTDEGRELIERVHIQQHAFERAVTSTLSPTEKRELARLLRRLRATSQEVAK
jgi:DNA-binding MarR family transcriptional regulator